MHDELSVLGHSSRRERGTPRKQELINRESIMEEEEEENAEIVPDGRLREDVTGIALALRET